MVWSETFVVYGYLVQRKDVKEFVETLMEPSEDAEDVWCEFWNDIEEYCKYEHCPTWLRDDVKKYDTFLAPHDFLECIAEKGDDDGGDGMIIGIKLMGVYDSTHRNDSYVYDDVQRLKPRYHPVRKTPWRLFLVGNDCRCCS